MSTQPKTASLLESMALGGAAASFAVNFVSSLELPYYLDRTRSTQQKGSHSRRGEEVSCVRLNE